MLMRMYPLVIATLMAAGCASSPQPAAKTSSPDSGIQLASNGTAETVKAAQKAGYKIVTKKGETLYCREDLKTGSHVRRDMICLTEEELEMARDAARRNVDQMQRATAIPQGK
jgi:hypothetical protein